MKFHFSDILVMAHLLWATFMVGGFIFAVVGIFLPACQRWVKLRTIHVVGIVFTASIPLWAGICPLTTWENTLRLSEGLPVIPRSFLAHYAHRLLYLDVPVWAITLGTTVVAVGSMVLYFAYPPWKVRRTAKPRRK